MQTLRCLPVKYGGAADGTAGIKPFRLVKFFFITGLAVFLVSTLVLSWVISNHTHKVLLERSEAYARVFAGNLNHQVFQQFVLPTVLRYGNIALRKPDQFKRLDAIVRNITHGMRIESVTIFDSRENVISYSTIVDLVGKKGQGGIEYQKALAGDGNSVLETNGSLLNLLPGADSITCRLRTYSPFRQVKPFGKNSGVIMGVIEIDQDLSEDLEAIIQLQGMIIGAAVLIMSALFTALWLIVARGDRIIEARAGERRRLEEKLHQAERLASLGKMVASVSHEIKNPLGIVRSTGEILVKRMQEAAPENVRLASIIVEETNRLDEVVREFLDFARPPEPRFVRTMINDVLLKAVRFMEAECEKRRISLAIDLDDSLPALDVDRELLYRAFLNVLINGMQAMPQGGTLTVATGKAPEPSRMVFVAVSDTGAGIAGEKQQQIFTPFFTDKTRGSGLGLAIVKNIVDLHHGAITVESEEGRGATFRIAL